MENNRQPFTRVLEVLRAFVVLVLCTAPVLSAFALYQTAERLPSTVKTVLTEALHQDTEGPSEETDAVIKQEDSGDIPVVCTRKEGVQNFLICGKDRASGLFDVIVLAQLDVKNNLASIVQIPRDTYAAYTEKSYKKLNGAAAALGGLEGLRSFLSGNLGIPIDHYALVDLDCVGDIVDAIGGVTLDIPADMDYEDKAQGLSIHLKAGKQTLNGDMAEQFLRFRAGYITADLGRLDAQKLFISAFLTEVKEHTNLPTIIRIVRSLYGRVETDLSIGSTLKLVASALKLRPDRLTMATLPGEATRTEENAGAWYYVIKRQAAYETVNRLLNVYETPIAEEAFDPDERFTSTDYPHFGAIYHSADAPSAPYNGAEAEAHYEALPRNTAGSSHSAPAVPH